MSRLFSPLPHPYYIWAPHYQQASGGVRALHYLCHALNLAGQEAYVPFRPTSPNLITPIISPDVRQSHFEAGRNPIYVYPEVVSDNPEGAINVVRWLLAKPGLHTGAPIQMAPRDQLFTFGPTLVPPGWDIHMLRIPLVDTRIYNNVGVDDAQRSGSAVFIHRHVDLGGELSPLTADSTEISFKVPPRSAEQLAEIFRSVELLYLYEYSTIVFEALLCGCPVVFIENETSLNERADWLFDGNGIAWGASEEAIAHAKQSVGGAAEFYAREDAEFWEQLENFVAMTQANAI